MPYLSPNDAPTGEAVDWDTSDACLSLGKAPDVGLIEPGDVILFAPIKPAFHQRAIMRAQRTMPAASQWTHAAVAFDRNRIVEAVVKGGVVCGDLFNSCADYKILVRRPSELTEVERMRFVIEAMSNITTPYNIGYAIRIALARTAWRRARSNAFRGGRDIVCSQFISNAYARSADRQLCPDRIADVTPAHIALTSKLFDVEIGWRPLLI